MINNYELFLISCVILMTIYVIISTGKHNQLYELFTNKKWFINFVIMVIFCVYILKSYQTDNKKKEKNVKTAVKKAIVAFIIAIYAELRLSIAPFWTIFIISYFLENWA